MRAGRAERSPVQETVCGGSSRRTAVDFLIVGAGVAGLSCAAALRERGADVRVVEKSRGVGGRCATRRIDGAPVDHGVVFYHGDDPAFLAALRSVEQETPFRWPRRIAGSGTPCQPRTLRRGHERLAFAAGVSAFPKHLAKGIRIDLETRVTRVLADGDGARVETASGREYSTRCVVLTPPAAQLPALLKALEPAGGSELAAVARLLSTVSMVRCLTVIARYPPRTRPPRWHVCYPEESDILQLASQDSSKRRDPERPVFVFQVRPGWSASQWDAPSDRWVEAVLTSARPLCGDWVGGPDRVDVQRWRYARLTGGDALTAPVLIRLENGARIGVAGEATAADGGVQAAWLAGRRMARRLLGERERDER